MPREEYEDLFRTVYTFMTEDEKRLCDFCQTITDTLYSYNQEMIELLKSHPDYYDELPELNPCGKPKNPG